MFDLLFFVLAFFTLREIGWEREREGDVELIWGGGWGSEVKRRKRHTDR